MTKNDQKWPKMGNFGPNWVNFIHFDDLLNNNTKKWSFYDRFRVFSYNWVKSCKCSSSRFSKFEIFTFSMAILRVSYTGNEPGKWPKMAYFWPKMAKIGQNWAKNGHFLTIFWSKTPFFDQILWINVKKIRKTWKFSVFGSKNAKKWAILDQK